MEKLNNQKNKIFRDCILRTEYSFDHTIFEDADYDKITSLKQELQSDSLSTEFYFCMLEKFVSLTKYILSCRRNYYFSSFYQFSFIF